MKKGGAAVHIIEVNVPSLFGLAIAPLPVALCSLLRTKAAAFCALAKILETQSSDPIRTHFKLREMDRDIYL